MHKCLTLVHVNIGTTGVPERLASSSHHEPGINRVTHGRIYDRGHLMSVYKLVLLVEHRWPAIRDRSQTLTLISDVRQGSYRLPQLGRAKRNS